MVAWQPKSGLSPEECDDLRLARHADFMHTLKKIGELSAEWEAAEGIQFHAAIESPQRTFELVAMAAHELVETVVVDIPEQAVA